ncbi:MAG: hypothetical protein PHU25_02510 [Deltaproteobacteria bacterium]|nr:hypothetical protein [Deltaproteobacteria bacterium]
MGFLTVLVMLAPAATIPQGETSAVVDAGVTAEEAETGQVKPEDLKKMRREIEAANKELGKLRQEVEEVRSELKEKDNEDLTGEAQFEPSLDISGFFDLTFYKNFIPENHIVKHFFPDVSTFAMQNLNLYFYSRMTESLSAFIELKFTFLPNGSETGIRDFDVTKHGLTLKRTDSTATDPLTLEEYDLGGVIIERAQLEWRPSNYFGIIAGRFLTPFGIWNTDHGPTVIIPIRYPNFQIYHDMPLAQTGLEAFGRMFPAANTYFDWAVTVSNGRGPVEATVDLDENKAVGLRLKLSYESPDKTFSLGGYGYTGDYTDTVKSVTLGGSQTGTSAYDEDIYEKYTEYVGSLDLLIELFGVRFQAEYLRRLVKYSTRPLWYFSDETIGNPGDWVSNSAYGLLAYELPLQDLIGTFKISPYVMADYYGEVDFSNLDAVVAIFGLNLKPVPNVVIKVEGTWAKHPDVKLYENTLWGVGAQLATSF